LIELRKTSLTILRLSEKYKVDRPSLGDKMTLFRHVKEKNIDHYQVRRENIREG